jgi:signal transduction histidine kinase
MQAPQRSMNPVDLLGKVIEVSHSNLQFGSRIRSILNMISQTMEFEEVLVYTSDRDKRLTCRFANDRAGLFATLSKYRCHIGEGVVGTVAQKRAPQFYSKKDVPPRFGCLFYPQLDDLMDHYSTFCFLPLADDSYLYGVLLLVSVERGVLRDPEKIFLSILAREIGGILRSSELILSSKRRISELATLSELGKTLTTNAEPQIMLKDIVLIVAKALNAVFVSIRLEYAFLKLGPQRFTYGCVDPSAEGHLHDLEAEALRTKQVAFAGEDGEEGGNEGSGVMLYSAPLVAKSRLLGAITICWERVQQDLALEEDGHYLINTIANYLSSGLENTLLNTRLRDAVRELSEAQKRLIEQEKFRSLGEMTANIAHEIKNPLVIIGGFAKRLAKRGSAEETESRYIDIILKEVERLETILNEVLSYVRSNPIQTGPCSLNDSMDEVLYLFASDTAWSGVTVVKEYDEGLPSVACDSQQIRQVFINILMNAYDAMQGKGTITIRTEQRSVDDRPFVVVSLTDTGGGIDPSIIDNIFNPFFTTKERGTGLGLAISNKIIMSHNGRIEIENVVGKGATFTVCLPLKDQSSREELL